MNMRMSQRAETLMPLCELATGRRLTLLSDRTTRGQRSGGTRHATEDLRRKGDGIMGSPAAHTQSENLEPPVPSEPALAGDIVNECGLGSFPASDPPSWWAQAGSS
jgi:hypothetical protein